MPTKRFPALALAISASALALGGCSTGGFGDVNRSLYSTKQPVVERTHYTLDIAGSPGGLPVSEQRRLAGWFEALDLGYGDRIAVDSESTSPAVMDAVQGIVDRYGLVLLSTAPVTEGFVPPGQTRVVVTRSTASVPGCPDWAQSGDGNFENKTHGNYGCAVNGNLAAMVADPEDLVRGRDADGEAGVSVSGRAIEAYRTGSGGAGATSGGATTGSD